MKKIILILISLCIFTSSSFGAVSQDVSIYVRQDVFDAKMEALFERLHGEIVTMKSEIMGEIKALSERVEGINTSLSNRIDGLEKRVEATNTFLYYLMVLFGAMLLLPFFNRWWEIREDKKKIDTSAIMAEVKRLIAEAQLGTRL